MSEPGLKYDFEVPAVDVIAVVRRALVRARKLIAEGDAITKDFEASTPLHAAGVALEVCLELLGEQPTTETAK